MKIFVINDTQISVQLKNFYFWIVIVDKGLQFLQTKHLQCMYMEANENTFVPVHKIFQIFGFI